VALHPVNFTSTATIQSPAPPVFTTASPRWPSSRISTQASALNPSPQQDFVLFDKPTRTPHPNQPPTRGQNLAAAERLEPPTRLSPLATTEAVPVPTRNLPTDISTVRRADESPARSPTFLPGYIPPTHGMHPSMVIQGQLRYLLFATAPPVQPTNLTPDHNLAVLSSLDSGSLPTDSSPEMASVFDVGPGLYHSHPTISPQMLLLQDTDLSAPNSSALTVLTSPSLTDDSPLWLVSPEFTSAPFDAGPDNWYPLFDDCLEPSPPPTQKTIKESQPILSRNDKSSSNVSRRHSSVSGVAPRSRNKPLPPIIIEDSNDIVAMKRARNTLAARKSRERKAQRLEDLEDEICRLKAERDHYKALAESLGGIGRQN